MSLWTVANLHRCGEDEKFLLAYVIFKLKLIKGKCIIFVSDIDRSYRLKLFFEQFGIRSCILNSELPVNSRIHVVEEFNRNVYDIIIASDEKSEMFGDEKSPEDEEEEVDAKAEDDAAETKKEKKGEADVEDSAAQPKKKRKVSRKDPEYGVSRGKLSLHIMFWPQHSNDEQALTSRMSGPSSTSISPPQHHHIPTASAEPPVQVAAAWPSPSSFPRSSTANMSPHQSPQQRTMRES
jgi:hypothetical protein